DERGYMFFYYCSRALRTLHSFPTRRSSDLLGRHLDGFGEIRITRLEPETAVAWEGERARGTVRIEPAGWGTTVILTAEAEGGLGDRKSTRLNSSHLVISYAVFCLKKKTIKL